MKCFVVPLQMPCVLLCPFSSSVSWQPGSQCWLPSCSVGLLPSCSALVLVCSPGRSVHSCRLPTHIFHLMFNSRSQNKAIDHGKSPKAEIYYFQSQKIRRRIGTNPYCEFPPAIGRSSEGFISRQVSGLLLYTPLPPSTLFPHHPSRFHTGESKIVKGTK